MDQAREDWKNLERRVFEDEKIFFFKFNKARVPLTRSTFCDVVDVMECLDQTKYRRQHVCCLISASLRLDIVLTR